MGGAVDVKGNQTSFSEFNFFNDPDAAKIVFDFPVNKVLVPLDVCNKILMQNKDFEKIKNEKIRDFILKIMKDYIDLTKKEEGFSGALMYDPLTVYSLLNPCSCVIEKNNLDVIVDGPEKGRTIKTKKGSEINVVKRIDKDCFKKDLIKILSFNDKETLLNKDELNILKSENEN